MLSTVTETFVVSKSIGHIKSKTYLACLAGSSVSGIKIGGDYTDLGALFQSRKRNLKRKFKTVSVLADSNLALKCAARSRC